MWGVSDAEADPCTLCKPNYAQGVNWSPRSPRFDERRRRWNDQRVTTPGPLADEPTQQTDLDYPLLDATHPLNGSVGRSAPLIAAALRRPVAHTPVWFMRQAGRSLPEYRKVREGVPMLESCFRTDLVTEITLQPVRRYGVDAAIFFSDIVVPLKAIGVNLDIAPGVGPVVAEPFRRETDVARLRALDEADVLPITAAVRDLVVELGPTPLIGFAGAPFTLASYLIEG